MRVYSIKTFSLRLFRDIFQALNCNKSSKKGVKFSIALLSELFLSLKEYSNSLFSLQ